MEHPGPEKKVDYDYILKNTCSDWEWHESQLDPDVSSTADLKEVEVDRYTQSLGYKIVDLARAWGRAHKVGMQLASFCCTEAPQVLVYRYTAQEIRGDIISLHHADLLMPSVVHNELAPLPSTPAMNAFAKSAFNRTVEPLLQKVAATKDGANMLFAVATRADYPSAPQCVFGIRFWCAAKPADYYDYGA